ncbi:MAG: cytochrome c family protein [Proteobacteria bacterium]|nr:cytochrome c family protein [Pseudomonadota bacterium]MBU1582609.1 cytochrome c family protein [Pseudomonadota bacterium]MBU2630072.1 cytochrome c family protein [Pseudomonadota bacterium]
MNNPLYASHTKPIVQFTHQTHIDKYSKSCGDCHHDKEGKPLNLKPDDAVAGCIECHTETQKVKGEKLEPAEKIKKYHQEALHANCIDCHKTYNIEKGDPKGKGPAPVLCNQCHKKS